MKTYFKIYNCNKEVICTEESPLSHSSYNLDDMIIPECYDRKYYVHSFEFNFNSYKIYVNLFPFELKTRGF